jgi:hypothetical protein
MFQRQEGFASPKYTVLFQMFTLLPAAVPFPFLAILLAELVHGSAI